MSGSSQPLAIDVRGIRRVYNVKPTPVVALQGVDLAVEPGEFFGLLGPNGAGKTTLIKILTTLLLPSAGTAKIFGFDVERQTKQIRRIRFVSFSTSKPKIRARPEVGERSVVMILMSVVLPAPFGPSSPKNSPGSTARSTPWRATTGVGLTL